MKINDVGEFSVGQSINYRIISFAARLWTTLSLVGQAQPKEHSLKGAAVLLNQLLI